jgi:hypothetical protein
VSNGDTALIGVILGFVGLLFQGWIGRRKSNAESDSLVAEATKTLLGPMQDRIDHLQGRVLELEAAERLHMVREQENQQIIARLKARVDLLVAQLRAGGITPADFGGAS